MFKVKAVETEEEKALQEKYAKYAALRKKKADQLQRKAAEEQGGTAAEAATQSVAAAAPPHTHAAAPDTAARPPVIGGSNSAFARVSAPPLAAPPPLGAVLPSALQAAAPALPSSAVPVAGQPKAKPAEAQKGPERVLKTKEEVAALLAQRRNTTAAAAQTTQPVASTGAAAAAAAAAPSTRVAAPAAGPAAQEGGDDGSKRAALKRPVRPGGGDMAGGRGAKRAKQPMDAKARAEAEWGKVLQSGGGGGGAHQAGHGGDGYGGGDGGSGESLQQRRVYVSRLPPNADRHELLQSMARFGHVTEVMYDANTSSGMVTFKEADVAALVVSRSVAFESDVGAPILVCEQAVLVEAASQANGGGPDSGLDGAALYDQAWGTDAPVAGTGHHDVDAFYGAGGQVPGAVPAKPTVGVERAIVSYGDL